MKIEAPDSGGTEFDEFPTALDPSEDFIEARGIAIQNDTSSDEEVLISRDADNNLTFLDPSQIEPMTLKKLTHGGSGLAYMREYIYENELAWIHNTYQFIICEQLTLEGELRIEGRAFIL